MASGEEWPYADLGFYMVARPSGTSLPFSQKNAMQDVKSELKQDDEKNMQHAYLMCQPSPGLCFWGHLLRRDLHQDLWSQMRFLQGRAKVHVDPHSYHGYHREEDPKKLSVQSDSIRSGRSRVFGAIFRVLHLLEGPLELF